MQSPISQLVNEAAAWLAQQPEAEAQSDRWYALGNLRAFISTIEKDQSLEGLARAAHALSYFISDQYEWSAEYCSTISEFLNRARRMERDLALLERSGN